MKHLVFRAFADILYFLGFWQAILWCEKLVGRRRHIVAAVYHHLKAADGSPPPPLAQGTPLALLDRQIRLLRRWYAPISIEDLETILDGKQELRGDGLLVTFDDGYLDCRTLAAPCLRRHGVPGLVFITTEVVESSRRFWWARLNDVVADIPAEAWEHAADRLVGPESVRRLMLTTKIDGRESRSFAQVELIKEIALLEGAQQEAILAHLETFAPHGRQRCLPLLTWRDMQQMQDDGFAFGGHTHTHPRLSGLPASQVRRELSRSGAILRQKLGTHPRSFAYPSGDYNESVRKEVSRSGFRLAFTTQPGVIVPGAASRYELPRIAVWRSGQGEIALAIVALKLMKYFPRLMRPILWRLLGYES